MRPPPTSRHVHGFAIAAAFVFCASAPVVLASSPADSLLAESRELLRNAEYDHNIDLLVRMLADSTMSVEHRRQAYLLLIKTHFYLRSHLRQQSQGATAADLNLRRARELTRECLQQPALRSTRPVPELEFPPEMVQMFTAVRGEVLGGFRVTSLSPTDARVVLDGDTLEAGPGDSASVVIEKHDLPVGQHQVLVLAAGHVPRQERIDVSPGTVVERAFTLRKRRSPLWYATRVATVVGVGTVVYLASRPEPEQDLPGPPPPPAAQER